MPNLLQKDSGFTLVELLVTVAIVGILASMGVGQYNEFSAKANDAIAAVAVKSLYTAMNAGKFQEAFEGSSGARAFGVGFLQSGTDRGQGSVPNSLNFSVEELYPGYVNNPDIRAVGIFSTVTNAPNNIQMYAATTHCKGSASNVTIPESQEEDGNINPEYSYLTRRRFVITSQIGSFDSMSVAPYPCD